jgi:hypothetical protein
MAIGEVLSRSWQIVWKYKVLWIFGVLAGLVDAGQAGSGNSGFRFRGPGRPMPELPPAMRQFFERLFGGQPDWPLIAGLVLLALVLTVLAIVLGTIGRAGLIRGVQLADRGTATLTFGGLFGEGRRYFWRMLALNLLIGVTVFLAVVTLVVVSIVYGLVTFGFGLLCILPFALLLVPLSWLLGIIVEQANVALVVEDADLATAWSRAWETVRNNLGTFIVMGLILIVGVGLISTVVFGLPLVIALAPVAGAALADPERFASGALIFGIVIVLAYLPVLIVLSGIVRAYVMAAWTLTYLRLHSSQPAPAAGMQPVAAR